MSNFKKYLEAAQINEGHGMGSFAGGYENHDIDDVSEQIFHIVMDTDSEDWEHVLDAVLEEIRANIGRMISDQEATMAEGSSRRQGIEGEIK